MIDETSVPGKELDESEQLVTFQREIEAIRDAEVERRATTDYFVTRDHAADPNFNPNYLAERDREVYTAVKRGEIDKKMLADYRQEVLAVNNQAEKFSRLVFAAFVSRLAEQNRVELQRQS